MAAWKTRVESASPQGQDLNINVTYFLSSDTDLTSPLGTGVVTVPASLSPANIQKQIVAATTDYRNSYNLIATYQGTIINVP
jgi:hypothetical protein